VLRAQESDVVVDDVDHAAAEFHALPHGLGFHQPDDEVILLQFARAGHIQVFGPFAQLAQRLAVEDGHVEHALWAADPASSVGLARQRREIVARHARRGKLVTRLRFFRVGVESISAHELFRGGTGQHFDLVETMVGFDVADGAGLGPHDHRKGVSAGGGVADAFEKFAAGDAGGGKEYGFAAAQRVRVENAVELRPGRGALASSRAQSGF
jgi:hypothetical protein